MKTHYLLESGIFPWKSIDRDQTNSLLTLTLLADTIEVLQSTINLVAIDCIDKGYNLILWNKSNFVFYNRVQKIKSLIQFTKPFYEYKPFLINYSENTYATLSTIDLPISTDGIKILPSDRAYIIQYQTKTISIETLSEALRFFFKKINLLSIKNFFLAMPNIILWKGYEDVDTHAAFQWIGSSEVILKFRDILQNSGINEISSRDQVVELINGS